MIGTEVITVIVKETEVMIVITTIVNHLLIMIEKISSIQKVAEDLDQDLNPQTGGQRVTLDPPLVKEKDTTGSKIWL